MSLGQDCIRFIRPPLLLKSLPIATIAVRRLGESCGVEAGVWVKHHGVWTTIIVAFAACTLACAGNPLRLPSEATRYVLDGPDGERALVLRLKSDVVVVEDGHYKQLAILRWAQDGVTVEDGNGRNRGRVVKIDAGKYRVVASSGSTLFELTSEPDGDIKLIDGDARRVYVIKRRNYGYKLLDAHGVVAARIRSRQGKLSVRDANGVTFLSTRDPIPLKSLVALMLEQIPLEYAAGLAVAIMRDAQESR